MTSATNLFVQKIKQDLIVKLLGQTANTLSFTANVLPATRIDPRMNNGLELVHLIDGSNYSGTYLVTDMTTTYANGTRDRTLSGIGHSIDGQKPTEIIDATKQMAKTILSSANNTSSNSNSSSSGGSGSGNGSSQPSSSKTTEPNSQMYYKDGKWYKA